MLDSSASTKMFTLKNPFSPHAAKGPLAEPELPKPVLLVSLRKSGGPSVQSDAGHTIPAVSPTRSALALLVALSLPALGQEPSEAAGITEPIADVALSPAVPGLVSAWKFKEGDFVNQDEVIIELDNRLETLEVERRKLAMDNRKADWEALQTLFQKSSISVKKEDLDKAETEYRIAVAEHQMATEQLRKRRIIAPCAGYVVEIVRDVGEACEAYQPLVRVADPRQCYFVSNVEAKAAGRLRLGQEVKLSIETSGEPVQCAGKVVFLSPVVDPASGLRKVKVLFDNAQQKINPGVAGKMRF